MTYDAYCKMDAHVLDSLAVLHQEVKQYEYDEQEKINKQMKRKK